jgi:ABC-type nitrate/sulfonate/bicarbonate transport system substrate-binding protein
MLGPVTIAYRDHDRTPLLYVLQDEAARHEDLDVRIVNVHPADEFEQGFLSGRLDFICEHGRFLPAARRDGHPVRYFASTGNTTRGRLVARPDITSMADLAGRTIAVRVTEASRPVTTEWLEGLGLAGKVQLLKAPDTEVGRWRQWTTIISGQADAAQCSPLYLDPALEAGLHVVEGPSRPSLGNIFLAGLGPFMLAHEAEVLALVRALYRALHTFRDDPETTLAIMRGEPARLMNIQDDALLRRQYGFLAQSYADRPLPQLPAIAAAWEQNKQEIAGLDDLDPLALWDLHYVLAQEEAHLAESLKEVPAHLAREA